MTRGLDSKASRASRAFPAVPRCKGGVGVGPGRMEQFQKSDVKVHKFI